MEATLLTRLVLPVAIVVIMFGLGLTLAVQDFARVARYPLAVALGLTLQLTVLPLVILALSPAGATSNMISYLSKGDLALAVNLLARTTKADQDNAPQSDHVRLLLVPGVSDAAYSSTSAYLADVCDILREIAELVRLGCTYIQFDAPEFGMLLDPHQQEWFRRKGFDPDRMVRDGVEMMNALMAETSAVQAGVTFGLHVWRGNDANRFMAKGSYAAIAEEVLPRTHARVILLEYDDEPSGDFSPLAKTGEDKVVVLGLVTTKRPLEETPDELIARIREASRYVPLERLAVSTQCGFASVAKGNNIPFDVQERKLALVAQVARKVWG